MSSLILTAARSENFRVQVGRRGEEVLVNPRSSAEMDVFDEVLVAQNYPLPLANFRPAMILDCGANIGYFACHCRLLYPDAQLICWEPDPRNFQRLSDQPLLKNNSNVELNNEAVGAIDGTVSLSGTGTGCVVQSEDAGRNLPQVRIVDLGEWLHRHAKHPLMIKLDIEGYEVEVIPRLSEFWKSPTALLLETHAPSGDDSVLISSLRVQGFQVKLIRQHALPDDPRVFKEYLATYA